MGAARKITGGTMGKPKRRGKFHPVYLFLVLPFAAMLWVPLYNRITPTLFGIPFFYWYQMAWTVLGALCILPVYLYEERRDR
jgi:hypothetical protein